MVSRSVILFLLLISSIEAVRAQCSSQSDQGSCTNTGGCTWDTNTLACVTSGGGGGTLCFDYGMDGTACHAATNPACSYSGFQQQCRDACSTYSDFMCEASSTGCIWSVGEAICKSGSCPSFGYNEVGCLASNCYYDATNGCLFSAPLPPPVVPATCHDHLTQSSCSTANCYWDVYLSQQAIPAQISCWDHLSVASANKTCSYWSTELSYTAIPVESIPTACEIHGCTMLGDDCVTPTSITSPPNTGIVYQTNAAEWSNPYIVPGTDHFGFVTSVPFGNVYSASTQWWSMNVGDFNYNIGTGAPTSVAVCTSLENHVNDLPLNYAFSVADRAQLDFNAAVWIDRYHHLDFTSWPVSASGFATTRMINGISVTDTFDVDIRFKTALQKSFGYIKSDSSSLVRNISLSADGEMLEFTWQMSLNAISTSCQGEASRRVQVSTTAEGATYVIPTSVQRKSADGGIVATSNTFYVTQSLTGSVTISPTSRYKSSVFIKKAEVVKCITSGYARLVIDYTTTFYNVEASAIVGPRDIDDLIVQPYAGIITNQYSDDFVAGSFVAPDCLNNQCVFHVKTESECRQITSAQNGGAFNSSQWALDVSLAGRTDLNGQHNWYMNVWRCDTLMVNCVKINQDTTPFPDLVSVNLLINAYPDQTMMTSIEVAGGLLADPSSVSLSSIAVLAVYPGSGTDGVVRPESAAEMFPLVMNEANRTRNLQLSWRQSITPVVRLVDSLMTNTDLRMGMGATNLKVTALYSSGEVVMNGLVPLSRSTSDLMPHMTYVTKHMKSSAACAQCSLLPIAAFPGRLGVDGFSIPILSLINLFGVSRLDGVQVDLTYYIGGTATYATAAGSGLAPPARRLLSQHGYDVVLTYNSDGTLTQTFHFYIDSSGLLTTMDQAISNVTVQMPHSQTHQHDTARSHTSALIIVVFAVIGADVLLFAFVASQVKRKRVA